MTVTSVHDISSWYGWSYKGLTSTEYKKSTKSLWGVQKFFFLIIIQTVENKTLEWRIILKVSCLWNHQIWWSQIFLVGLHQKCCMWVCCAHDWLMLNSTADYFSCWKSNFRDLKYVYTEVSNWLDNWCAIKRAQVEIYWLKHTELSFIFAFCFLIFHIHSIYEKVLWMWKINLEILTHIFSTPDYKKWFSEWHLFICLYICTDVHITIQ